MSGGIPSVWGRAVGRGGANLWYSGVQMGCGAGMYKGTEFSFENGLTMKLL